MAGKFVIDISTLVHWVGTPVGLVRVQRELAVWAHKNLTNAEFAFFDLAAGVFRRVEPRWLDPILSGNLAVWDCPKRRRGEPERLQATRPKVLPQLRPRRTALLLLERIRLAARSARLATFVERLQAMALTAKYTKALIDAEGRRRTIVTYRSVVGGEVVFGPETTLVVAGLVWPLIDVGAIARLKRQTNMAFVLYCPDMIPLQFPHFFPPEVLGPFEADYRTALPLADLTVVTARKIEEDIRSYCRRSSLTLGKVAVLHLGADAAKRAYNPQVPLPEGLERDRYALFVSTIEPRKGHDLIYRTWLRLLSEGVPQTGRFRLVFAGRKGWMVDELMRNLESDDRLQGTLTLIHDASDALLQTLYANAAFCLFPSAYEGFGLPLVEAFVHGKAVIASTGGALRELAEGFSPCLDPNDEEAWYATLKSWMLDPGERLPYERAIETGFRAPTWDEFGADFFSAAAALRSQPASPAAPRALATAF